MIVRTREELETLPDGTIITWLRIPGDRTSEAVAFVRSEIEYDDGPHGPTATGAPVRTVWLSPGGWHPLTIEQAGVTYPVTAFSDPTTELEITTLDKGGTWAREAALVAAARVFQGHADVAGDNVLSQRLTTLADYLIGWLTDDPLPPLPPVLDPPMSEDDAETALYNDLRYLAREQNMPNASAALALALARRGWRK